MGYYYGYHPFIFFVLYFSGDVRMMGIPQSMYMQVCLINYYRLSFGGTYFGATIYFCMLDPSL